MIRACSRPGAFFADSIVTNPQARSSTLGLDIMSLSGPGPGMAVRGEAHFLHLRDWRASMTANATFVPVRRLTVQIILCFALLARMTAVLDLPAATGTIRHFNVRGRRGARCCAIAVLRGSATSDVVEHLGLLLHRSVGVGAEDLRLRLRVVCRIVVSIGKYCDIVLMIHVSSGGRCAPAIVRQGSRSVARGVLEPLQSWHAVYAVGRRLGRRLCGLRRLGSDNERIDCCKGNDGTCRVIEHVMRGLNLEDSNGDPG